MTGFAKFGWGIVGGLVGVLVLVQILTLGAIYEQSNSNGLAARNAADAARRIEDCTSPAGKCYRRSQQRTKAAIVGINEGTLRVVAAIESCRADGVTEQGDLIRCAVELTQETENGR